MSGFGERFRNAGYRVPKPLINIEGKPIIAHIIDMFPGELNFIFICNQNHLDEPSYHMAEIIQKYCPSGRIVPIPAHNLGPIHAVQQVEHLLNLTQPVVVNYCDFTCYWDWHHFKQFVKESACAGAIPAYKGFHPHTLGNTNYAYLLETNGWVDDIQEKQPYTKNRMDEFASSGTYYFATAQLMRDVFLVTTLQDLNVGGEYYVSLAYKAMLASNQSVAVYPLQHFMQWGTPEDVAEYNRWSAAFRHMIEPQQTARISKGSVIIPMAGLGQRFADEGYTVTKPLITISGKPMVVQAVNDLPPAQHYCFVLRSDMSGHKEIANTLKQTYENVEIETIPMVTEGQACTALIGLNTLEQKIGNIAGPITFGACDNGVLYDHSAFQALVENPEIDVIVWGACGHANAIRHPQMYGWIDADNGQINCISVKAPLSSPATDPIVLGTFTFRCAADFRKVVERLIARDARVSGEFYIDSCINDAIDLGLKCYLFEVDSFLSWGTPNDLRTFEYWQSCFHKWVGHPYRLELDSRISHQALKQIEEHYCITGPDASRTQKS
jgi:NDP-sugar pyrophosphorylase family protein